MVEAAAAFTAMTSTVLQPVLQPAITDTVLRSSNAISNWYHLKGNYKRLEQEAQNLEDIRYKVEKEISKNKITEDTRKWIAQVRVIESEATELKTKYEHERRHYWKLHRFSAHAELSEGMKTKYKQVCSLLDEGKVIIELNNLKLPEPVKKTDAPRIEGTSSLHATVLDILSFLEDEQIRRIGVWGMVGTGKTTIMQNLNNHEQIAKMFNIVIWVAVSKEWSIEKLQDIIMRRLELEPVDNTEENAHRISKELKGKKCLVLLDEVHDFIDLNEVMEIHNNEGVKVVLASRRRDICIDMDADELINMRKLSPSDSWNMFQEIVGPHICSPLIKRYADLVVRECDGLPLLIHRIGKTFKKKGTNASLWKEGLDRLRRWNSGKIEGMDEVFDFLNICYDDLDGNQKNCFLYGALYSEEFEICIDKLLECWYAEGFIHGTNVFTDARVKGHAILDALIEVSLLESTDKKRYVKMNKVLRRMALKISSQWSDSKFVVKPCEGVQDFTEKTKWKDATRISLMDNQLCSLPESPDCCNLSTLLLQRNNALIDIPELFFQSMRRLRVLDLHRTGIESLPPSISELICLRVLYLNSCAHLRQLPSTIKALEQLEVLDIQGTKLNFLQIESLIWLKCLRISLSNLFTKIQRQLGSISRFVSLEEFCVDNDLSKHHLSEVSKIMEGVVTLAKLTSFRFYCPSVDSLKVFVRGSRLWQNNSCFTFQFSVGQGNTYSQILKPHDYPSYNWLQLVNGKGMDPAIAELLEVTNAFILINHDGVSMLSDFGVNMQNMLVCSVEGCSEMTTIADCGDRARSRVLENLEALYIKDVLKLRSIWEGTIPNGSLAQLTNLTLTKCPELKKIFSKGMIKQLPELQNLRVEECHQIEEIVMESENVELAADALPRLKTLVLIDLPELKSIWVDDSLEWPSLQRIKISQCPELKRLPLNDANAAKLRVIEGQQSWWEALVWDSDAFKQRLQPFCNLS